MNVLTIIVVVWSSFISTEQIQFEKVQFEQSKHFVYKSNCEAILQDNDETIIISEEVTSLYEYQLLKAEAKSEPWIDKERPAT
jgi:hypothetical protein